MDDFVGLDVSMKETAISIRRAGTRVWRGKCVLIGRVAGIRI
ncbi:hypothetical protein [Mesorhizobium sp. A623]